MVNNKVNFFLGKFTNKDGKAMENQLILFTNNQHGLLIKIFAALS